MSQFHVTWRCETCQSAGEIRFPVPCDVDDLKFAPWTDHAKRSPECDRVQDGAGITATVAVDHATVPLSRRQAALFDWIEDYMSLNTCAPSFAEIADAFGYRSLATIHEHLTSLERRGWIKRRYNESRSIEILVSRPRRRVQVPA